MIKMSQEENRKRAESAGQYQQRRYQMRGDHRPVQPNGHLHNMAFRQQPNPYWLNHNQQNHTSFPGPRHLYPVHQMFMQHGPFGNSGNQFLPAPLPHFPNPMRFPPNLPSPSYNNENRRNRMQYNYDMDCFQDFHRYRGDYNPSRGRGFGHDRPLRCENGQGARPKTTSGRFQKEKNRVARKKKHQTSSSNRKPSPAGAYSTTKDQTETSAKGGKDFRVHDMHSVSSPCLTESAGVENGPGGKEDNVETGSEHRADGQLCQNGVRVYGELEGAVGGADCVEQFNSIEPFLNEQSMDPSVYDKNLIDEGAICDLDSMFCHQEFSRLNGDVKGFFTSDDTDDHDDDCEDVGFSPCDSLRNTDSDNKSNGEASKSEQLFSCASKEPLGPPFMLSSLGSPSKSATCFSSQQTAFKLNMEETNNLRRNEVEDVEDTGDFIDTDLPAQCLLSSSDEMDNASSSEQEEDSPCLPNDPNSFKLPRSDINCNEVLSPASNLLPEAMKGLSIGTFENHSLYTSTPPLSSHDKNLKSPVECKKRRRQCNTCIVSGCSGDSSDSENDESNKTGPNFSLKPKTRGAGLDYSRTGDVCGDGAAASQVVVDEHLHRQKEVGDTGLPCVLPRHAVSPPGADSEVVVTSQQCMLLDNPLSIGATQAPSVAVPIAGSGPSAITASYEPSPADACSLSARAEPAACSTTASGGACCPPGHQQSQASGDSSACCQGQARVKSLTTSHGAGVETPSQQGQSPHSLATVTSAQQAEGDSYSASSCNAEMNVTADGSYCQKDIASDGSGPEDPSLSHDSSDNIDMVLLPMEEEIEPVLRMGSLVCGSGGGGGAGTGDIDASSSGLAAQGLQDGTLPNLYEDHDGRHPLEQGHLRGAVPSKEFYELIKTVSTTDSYMRFYDKDGHDVQRERVCGSDDEQNHEDGSKADRLRVDRVMIWDEYEAYVMQFKQIAVSACGQTAVLNVLKALKIPCEKSVVCKVIQGSLRKEDADIPEYLFSRAVAGTTAEELMSGIETLSNGAVGGRFFPFWPPRKIKLLQWLACWMKRGAIPMATLNLQQGPHSLWQVPDSWHHQMVYGVSHQGLYLTNPLEIVSERSAMKQLCSDSVLMVRRQDIISRYRKTTDLGQLLSHPDTRWSSMNVLGQVVNVLREFNMPSVPGYRLQVTSHISIPACYRAGITLFMRKDKAAWATLLSAPDLPIIVQTPSPSAETQQTAAVAGAGAL